MYSIVYTISAADALNGSHSMVYSCTVVLATTGLCHINLPNYISCLYYWTASCIYFQLKLQTTVHHTWSIPQWLLPLIYLVGPAICCKWATIKKSRIRMYMCELCLYLFSYEFLSSHIWVVSWFSSSGPYAGLKKKEKRIQSYESEEALIQRTPKLKERSYTVWSCILNPNLSN